MAYAVIGEALYPQSAEKQEKLRNDLKDTLDYINNYYQEDIVSGFRLTRENEFQGMLSSGVHLLEILDIIQFRFTSVSVRFGVGVDKTDGGQSALEAARKALTRLSQANDYQVSKILLLSEEEAEWLDMVNESLHLCDYIQGRWKSLQSMIMEITILKTGYAEPPKQTELAEIFKTSKQNINRAVRGMGYQQYIRAKREIQKLLQEKWG
ncbi:MAG TPA: hypothetical protein DCZ20_11855 [Lachnospiraceae bacterium]|nr:hypothetical protein [Lachnospiraceae bacterium]